MTKTKTGAQLKELEISLVEMKSVTSKLSRPRETKDTQGYVICTVLTKSSSNGNVWPTSLPTLSGLARTVLKAVVGRILVVNFNPRVLF